MTWTAVNLCYYLLLLFNAVDLFLINKIHLYANQICAIYFDKLYHGSKLYLEA